MVLSSVDARMYFPLGENFAKDLHVSGKSKPIEFPALFLLEEKKKGRIHRRAVIINQSLKTLTSRGIPDATEGWIIVSNSIEEKKRKKNENENENAKIDAHETIVAAWQNEGSISVEVDRWNRIWVRRKGLQTFAFEGGKEVRNQVKGDYRDRTKEIQPDLQSQILTLSSNDPETIRVDWGL